MKEILKMQNTTKSNGGYTYNAPFNSEKEIKKPNLFYPVCVDNFFKNPNLIRDLGLKLDKESDPSGRWPGYRSVPLWMIDENLNTQIILKILNSYFDLSYQSLSWKSSEITFQIQKGYSENSDSLLNQGWIHQDSGEQLAGLIYLTPDADLDTGTSLFNLKEEYKNSFKLNNTRLSKSALYLNQKIDEQDYVDELTQLSNKFVEKTRFNNIYNRMIAYDSNEWHRANKLKSKYDRLTMVFFISDIELSEKTNTRLFPVERINDEYDNNIEKRIKLL